MRQPRNEKRPGPENPDRLQITGGDNLTVAQGCPCDCPFDPVVVAEAADRSFALGRPVVVDGLIVAPDVGMLAGIANGLELPPTWRLRRDDGRTVWIYRDPLGRAA